MATVLEQMGMRPPGGGAAPTPPSGGGKSFDIVDFKQYFHIIVKRIWLVALCFVIALSVMVVILVRQVPYYSSTATILLSRGLQLPVKTRQQEETDILGDYIATQKRIIESRLILSRAKERLNLPADEINAKLMGYSVYPIYQTAFLSINCVARDPVFCADFANALAEEYLDFKAEERMDTSQATVISLTQQANRLHEELKRAEEQLLNFTKENNVVGMEELGNIAAASMGALASEAARYRTERMLMEAQQPLLSQASDDVVLATLASPLPSYYGMGAMGLGRETNGLPFMLGSASDSLLEYRMLEEGSWQGLKRQNALLQSKLTALRAKFRDAHPAIQRTLAELKENEQALDVELQFALRQYYSKLESLSIKEQAAQRVQQEWREQAVEVSKKAQEYKNLQRNFNRLQGLYDLVFNRLKEIDIALGIEPESVRIMERAQPSYAPVTPRRIQSLFLAALVGLGIGLGLVFLLEYIDDSIRYPEEVTRGLGLHFLGVVPSANWDVEDLRAHILSNLDQKSGLAEAYRNIRSAILLGRAGTQPRTMVITSAVPREGKTTTCLNVAISFAQAGSRVLMVDADMRRGELHKFFGLEGGRGLADLLMGQTKPETVVQRTGIPNLDLIATGPFPANPSEITLRPEMQSFLEYAKRNYDYIFFDCPPVMAVSESAILAAIAEAVVMVVWAGRTSRKLAQLTTQVLRERGANIVGCVLNNLEFGRVGYYYYSTYYGYYNYDYHYGKDEGKR